MVISMVSTLCTSSLLRISVMCFSLMSRWGRFDDLLSNHEDREGHEGAGYVLIVNFVLFVLLCLKVFSVRANFLAGHYYSMQMLFAAMVRGPLSSLPRDGGDVRGGSFDAFYLVAAPPR